MDETEFFTRAFLKRGSRGQSLSIDEVRRVSRPAWNFRGTDRFYYDPYQGSIHFGDALDLPGAFPWIAGNSEAVPKDGWQHDEGCDCVSCRRRLCHEAGKQDRFVVETREVSR